jgi:hypothetical protein
LTIDATLSLLTIGLFAGFILVVTLGWLQIQSARRLPYFLLRRERITRGWRLLMLGGALAVLALLFQIYGRQVAYTIVPPTPSRTPTFTITSTPTITRTPTISSTPTVTATPSISPTASETSIPVLPETITLLIRETVTPDPEALLSEIEVAARLDNLNRAINPAVLFENPVGRLYGAFSYNNLQDGLRWTAIWYRVGEMVCFESQAWDGGTGGYGYTECELEQWEPGEYEIQIFLGERWVVSTRYSITGDPPTPSATPIPTVTIAPPS